MGVEEFLIIKLFHSHFAFTALLKSLKLVNSRLDDSENSAAEKMNGKLTRHRSSDKCKTDGR